MSTRPPPEATPRYAVVTGLYRYNLRPVVITLAVITGLWALFDGIGNFRSISIDRQDGPKLAVFSIVLGALDMAIFAFQMFGIFAAGTQRLPLIRTYTYLSAATTLIMVASGLLSVVVHFLFKNDIINECTTLNENQTFLVYPFGFFGPVYHDFVNQDDANAWCHQAWDGDSVSEIISLLAEIFIGCLFTSVAFSYYRQVLDPSSPANYRRTQAVVALGPTYYNAAPYNASLPNLGYGNGPAAGRQYAPPAGPPPANKEEDPFADFTEVNASTDGLKREMV